MAGATVVMPPPYKNKMIEPIHLIPRAARLRALENAGFNTFLLQSDEVFIDLLTDSGTGAMSQEQWAALMRGDEAYAGSVSFAEMERAVQDVFGYPFVVPTHQGRGAERIVAEALIKKKGQFVLNNLYFTTSRAHQELAGGKWVDVSVDAAGESETIAPFKGNIDTEKLRRFIKKKGAARIAFVRIEASLNMAGGQPFSMENVKKVSDICRHHKIFLLLDATRVSENALFIKEREKGYGRKPLAVIIKEICSLTDGCTMSSKKDHYVNIGGFLATRNTALFQKAKELDVLYEGFPTYGGMAGRDMEALAVGIRESAEESYVSHYIGQVKFLQRKLRDLGIPVAEPPGAHAVFVDAKRFLPHIPQKQFPAQTLAAEIYAEGGVRTMERGIVSGQHGKEPYYGLELVRVTLPRRVYETAHLAYVAEVIAQVYERRHAIRGLRMTYAPKDLRFFQARFKRM
ncbi:MAG: tryptophanase [Parcubacteria group bacterium]|nr:tryptophanase [Parcubacteria group bacterium]